MFNIGDCIIYGNNGVCRIDSITQMNISGKEEEYYVLVPLFINGSTLFCPAQNTKLILRKVISHDDALKLIDKLPQIPLLHIDNEKNREFTYKEALKTAKPEEWVKVIKTLYTRTKERESTGKLITYTDKKYLGMAENFLYGELSVALSKDKDDMQAFIENRIDTETV